MTWWSNARIELGFGVLVFVEGGKPGNQEKNPWSRDKNQQPTQPTCDDGSGNWTQLVVGGERSQYRRPPCIPLEQGENQQQIQPTYDTGRESSSGHIGKRRAALGYISSSTVKVLPEYLENLSQRLTRFCTRYLSNKETNFFFLVIWPVRNEIKSNQITVMFIWPHHHWTMLGPPLCFNFVAKTIKSLD